MSNFLSRKKNRFHRLFVISSDPFSNLRREGDKFTTIDLPFRHSSAAFILLLSNRNKTALLLVLTSFPWTIICWRIVRSSKQDDYLRRLKRHLYRVSSVSRFHRLRAAERNSDICWEYQ